MEDLPPTRLLVIFDLDETLVHATADPSFTPADFTVDRFRVRRRPMLEHCLRQVSNFADIAVWSSAGDAYVHETIAHIMPPEISLRFAWARSRCTRRYDLDSAEEYWVKDLKKVKRLGYPLERILIVDDSPEKTERHYGNYVRVEPFFGDPQDRVLTSLGAYLARFAGVSNVRTIEKRGWHARPAPPAPATNSSEPPQPSAG